MGFKKCFLYKEFAKEHAGRDCPEYEEAFFTLYPKSCKHKKGCMGFRDNGFIVCEIGTWRICPRNIPDMFNSHVYACYGCKPRPEEYPNHPNYKEE